MFSNLFKIRLLLVPKYNLEDLLFLTFKMFCKQLLAESIIFTRQLERKSSDSIIII